MMRGANVMAAKERFPDDERDGDEEPKPKKKAKEAGPMKLVIVGAIALFVAVLGAQVAAPILTRAIEGDPSAPKSARTDDEQLALADELVEEDGATGEAADEPHSGPAIYTPLDPPFVVSFEDEERGSRFLQLTLQAMARDEHTIDQIKTHAPALRNAFLFLISGYKIEDLATLQGKEKLRAEMIAKANEIMERNTGKAGIEEIFFTSLVIQ
jgi:flagellar FliL protein